MSVTVKVFYEKTNGPPEIRRFPLNNDRDCFIQTKEKIKNLYPVLADEHFQLFWKDSDGDRIAFSSAEEMKDALNYVTDGVFRVFISEVKKGAKPKEDNVKDKIQNQPKASHQQQQQQSQAGASSSSSSSFSQSQSQSQDGPLHPNISCDGCDGPVKGLRYKCCVCPDYDLCSACEGKGLHSDHDMYKITHPRTNHPFGFLPPHFSQHIHTGAHNAAHAAASAAAQAAAASFGHPNSNSGQSNQSKEGRQANHDEYLKNVGANIAAFLDPFGIDVTYDVHHNNGQQQHGHWSSPCGGNQRPFWRRGNGCPAWENMEKRAARPKKQADAENISNENNKSGADAMDTQDPSSNGKEIPSTGVPMEDVSKEQEGRPGTDEWTFVPDDGSEVHVPNPDTAIPMPAPPTIVAPNPQETSSIPQGPATQYPSGNDMRLQQSLDQMLAMGFSNTDNWLSDLLMENRCDIGQTLDAIKAKATQQLDSLRK